MNSWKEKEIKIKVLEKETQKELKKIRNEALAKMKFLKRDAERTIAKARTNSEVLNILQEYERKIEEIENESTQNMGEIQQRFFDELIRIS